MNNLRFKYLSFAILLLSFTVSAQAPNEFKYQSIARDLNGAVLANSPVSLRISIRDLSPTGTIVFQETHSETTNEFGLFTVSIGAGTPLLGSIATVLWGSGSKYMDIEADLTGGTNYQPMGVSQLLSVPYALYANQSGVLLFPNGTAVGNTTYWDGTNWVVNSNNLYNAGANIGIGTTTPAKKLDVNGHMNISNDSSYMIDNIKILTASGISNLYVGEYAGLANTIGSNNSFVGYNSGLTNLVGSQNTFLGSETGVANLDGSMNSFLGRRAGFSNTNGYENTFLGAYAGQTNTSGEHNSFLGVTTGSSNTTGSENTFLGAHAGYFNDIGSYNTFVGNFAGENNNGGNFNTLLGFECDLASPNLTNATAMGYGAVVSSSNSIVIGNTAVTSIGGQVGWSTLSDQRLKTDVQKNQLGLDFIKGLKTVSYQYNTPGQENKRYSGLIAQDVEALMNEHGVEFSGLVKPENDSSFYSIRYAEFVIPLIKAVQEQSEEIEKLKVGNAELLERL